MKNKIMILLSILFSGHIFAQRSFYIRPKLENKIFITSTNFTNFYKPSLLNTSISFKLKSNPYSEVSVSPLSYLTVYNLELILVLN